MHEYAAMQEVWSLDRPCVDNATEPVAAAAVLIDAG